MAFCRTGPRNEYWSSILSSRIFTKLNIPAFSTHECAYSVNSVKADFNMDIFEVTTFVFANFNCIYSKLLSTASYYS